MKTYTRPSTYKKRLLKLSDFLCKLPRTSFNYRYIVQSLGVLAKTPKRKLDETVAKIDSNPERQAECGFLGCAVGWLPFAFPRDFRLKLNPLEQSILLRKGSTRLICGKLDDAAKFFGLSVMERNHLFQPGAQTPRCFGGTHLSYDATAKAVAKNIRAFVAKKYPTKG